MELSVQNVLLVPSGGRSEERFLASRPTRRPGLIEIDSTDRDRSRVKLEPARDRDALPIWIRWRDGSARPLPRVHVVDLTGRHRDSGE